MWYFNNKEYNEIHDEKIVGFVYKIIDLVNDKFYIGKKLFFFAKTKQVKGKKKKFKAESDWKTYYGSNDELKQKVIELGANSFRREIIRFCTMKGELSYYESKAIFEEDALLQPNCYNQWISCKITRRHLTKFQL